MTKPPGCIGRFRPLMAVAAVSSGRTPIPVCFSCQQAHPLPLASRAERGELQQFCRECYFIAELRAFLWALPSDDPTRAVAADALETIWGLVRERILERERFPFDHD